MSEEIEVTEIEQGEWMTERQRAFVAEYLVDLDGTNAARRAGYAPKHANKYAFLLLQMPKIRAAIDEQMRARQTRTRVTADRVIAEIAKIAFADLGEIFDDNGNLIPVKQMPPDVRAAIASLEIETSEQGEGAVLHVAKTKLADKLSALNLLAKHMGLMTEKLDVTVNTDKAAAILAARQRERARRAAADKPPADEGDDG